MDEDQIKVYMESCPNRDFRCSEYASYDKIRCIECPHLTINTEENVSDESCVE